MRKFYLFFAGALLSIPAVAQTQELKRYPDDPKVIFRQTFEVEEGLTENQAYKEWSTTPIDTIHKIEYYSKIGTSSVSSRTDIYDGSADWEIFAVRTDSTSSEYTEVKPGEGIVMFNGADPTSSKDEIAAGVYNNDHWAIVGDNGTDKKRKDAFSQYGEDGGKYFFQWTTGGLDKFIGGSSNAGAANWAGKNWTSHYSSDTRSVKKYRRDLYVRGLDIEEESSYRLTFYVKTQKFNTWDPILYADVMRGYHHQRSAFSMGYKSGKEFSLTKNDFDDGVWEKVTLMTYYINGHESDGYVMYSGDYSWTDDWTWRPSDEMLAELGKTLNPGEYLNYVKQPDKFFVRLSFATDSIEYSLDNLTLTKSWIAGCEYDKDMMRIDFGYETNLKGLAQAAFAENKIAQKEVIAEVAPDMVDSLGYDYYFEVWGLNKEGEWEDVPIRSAEYHDDGYMYMFTEFFKDESGEYHPFLFDDYDSVLVTFHNPVDQPDLCLKYTGSLYPKALDSAWVANGKIVPDFRNEIAQANPTIFNGIHSLQDLPPVMQIPPYEEGSFGLASTNELRFKFSRVVIVKNDTDPLKKAVAYVNNEKWELSWDDATSELVLTRPSSYSSALKGDYEIQINQIYGVGTDKGENVVMHYHFGDFSTVITGAAEYTHSDWRSALTDPDNNEGCVPTGVWTHCYYNSAEQFEVGAGQQASGKVRLYLMDYTDLDNCGFYLSSRNTKGNSKAKYSGNIFTIVNFTQAGSYSIKFKVTGWDKTTESSAVETHFYLYPKPSGDVSTFDFSTFTSSDVVATKTDLGSIDATTYISSSKVKDVSTGKWPDGVETAEYTFTIPAAGDYVFEWCIFNGSSSGLLIGNYTISTMGSSDLSTAYVKKLNNAVAAAEAKLADANAPKYKGEAYNKLAKTIEEGKAYKGNFPSKYDSVVAYINSVIKEMGLRMDTVNLFYTTEGNVSTKLAGYNADNLAKYKDLATYKALETHLSTNASWDCSVKATADITAEIKSYENEMTALDSRMAAIDDFAARIAATKALIDAADARKDYDEYAQMVSAYDQAAAYDVVKPADDELTAASNALVAAKNQYLFKYDFYVAKTRQIKELFALADALGYEFEGDKAGVEAKIAALEDDDAMLSSMLREAAILQIYTKFAAGEDLDSLDVSALIPNYFLYNDAEIGRDMENNNGTWRITKAANSTAIPGWTITPTGGTSCNWYPTTESNISNAGKIDWEVDGHVFAGGLRCGSYTQGTVGTEIVGLPQAYYWFGFYGSNQTSNVSATIESDTTVLYNDNIKNLTGAGGGKFSNKEVGVDSIIVKNNLKLLLSQTSSSSSMFDIRYFVLRLRGIDSSCDFSAAIAAQQKKLGEIITIVDAPVQSAGVQYFNLSGMQIAAPKAGEIVIRRTVRDGKAVVEKVLIK